MGSIQTGQIQTQQIERPTFSKGSIQTGRVLPGITSYDEKLRQQLLSRIKSEKEYQTEQSQLDIQIKEQQDLINRYEEISDKVKNMDPVQYISFYDTIPSDLKKYFSTPQELLQSNPNLQDYINEQKLIQENIAAGESRVEELRRLIRIEDQKIAQPDYTGGSASARRAKYIDELNDVLTGIAQLKAGHTTMSPLDYYKEQEQMRIWSRTSSELQQEKLRQQEAQEKYMYEYEQNVLKLNERYGINKINPDSSILTTEIKPSTLSLEPTKALTPIYYDKLGQPISYDPNKAKTSLFVGPTQLIGPLPKSESIFISEVKQKGVVKGTLSYLGNKAEYFITPKEKQKITFSDIKPYKTRGSISPQDEFIKLLNTEETSFIKSSKFESQKQGIFGTVTTLPYFTPLGSSLLAVGGFESVARAKDLKEVGLGVAESTIGMLGYRSQIKSYDLAKFSKNIESIPTTYKFSVAEGEKGGMMITYAKKQSGTSKIESYVQQPFKQVGENKVISESGRGLSLQTIKGKPTQISSFETGGKTIQFDTTPRLKSTRQGITTTVELPGDASISKIYTKEMFKGKVTKLKGDTIYIKGEKTTKNINYGKILNENNAKKTIVTETKIFSKDGELIYKKYNFNQDYDMMKVLKFNKPKDYGTYLNVVAESDKGIGVLSAEMKGLKRNIFTDELTASGKLESYGIGKRIIPDTEQGSTIISSGGNLAQETKKTLLLTTAQAQQGLKYVQPSLSKTSFSSPGSFKLISPTYTQGGLMEEPTKSIYYGRGNIVEQTTSNYDIPLGYGTGNKNIELLKTETKPLTIPKTKLINIETTKQNSSFSFSTPSKTNEQEKTKTIDLPKFKENLIIKQSESTKQPIIEKQGERLKTPTKTKIITKIPLNIKRQAISKTPKSFLIPRLKERMSNIRKQQLLSKAYTVLVRSKGKVREVGKGLTYGKALKLGVSKTKGSLAQTFALKQEGFTKEKDIGYKLPTTLYTTPKRKKTLITELTFVEQRGKTLTTYPEVTGLQKSKKTKRIKFI